MINRIVKFGVGADRPGDIVYEAKLTAEDLEGFASQIRDLWASYTAQVEALPDEDVFLHLIVQREESGADDFEIEDELIELLDP